MPRCYLPNYAVHASFTPTHVWYSDNHNLRRRNLATNVDEEMHWFESVIHRIQADAVRCVVDTYNPFYGHILWINRSKGWEALSDQVCQWDLTPERILFNLKDGRRCSWHIAEARFYKRDDDLLPIPIAKQDYWVVNAAYNSWLTCNSRAAFRLERLLGVANTAQLLNHA